MAASRLAGALAGRHPCALIGRIISIIGNWLVVRTGKGGGRRGEALCCECAMSVFLISGKGMVVRAARRRITAGRWQRVGVWGGGEMRIDK